MLLASAAGPAFAQQLTAQGLVERNLEARGGADDMLPRELASALAGQLAPYKLPARIVVLPALPAGATGKVLKAALRDLAAALPAS